MAAMTREAKLQSGRELVLDAAERLLRKRKDADFSMRELAAEAGVSFATPFNQFGSKAAIMQALSARLIAQMAERFGRRPVKGDAIARTLAMVAIAARILLEDADVNRAVIGSLGTPSAAPGAVSVESRRLWSTALGDYEGIATDISGDADSWLPDQLAFTFRGCLSFWVAGEIADHELVARTRAAAAASLLGVASGKTRRDLLDMVVAPGPLKRT